MEYKRDYRGKIKLNKIVAKLMEKLGLVFINRYLKYRYLNKVHNNYLNERSIEYEFILNKILEEKCIDILDVGTGSNSFSSMLEHCGYNVTATDLKKGSYWANFSNRHIYVVKDDIINSDIKKNFDAILCVSVLEHISDFNNAVKGMVKLLKNDGLLIMTFPYSDDIYCDNIYKLDDADSISKKFRYIGQSFSKKEIEQFCSSNDLEVISTQFAKGWSGKFWRTGQRYSFPKKVSNAKDANVGCFLFKKNIFKSDEN